MWHSIYDGLFQDNAWETMRERTFIQSGPEWIVRRPASQVDQIKHSLGLRRTKAGDRTGLGNTLS